MKKSISVSLAIILSIGINFAQSFDESIIPFKHQRQVSKQETSIKAKYRAKMNKSTILDEDFEGGIPADWSLYTLGDPSTWETTTAQAHSGTTAAYHDDTDAECDNWLVSPQVTIDNAGYFFTVWQYEKWGTYYETHEIVVSTGSGDPADGDFTQVIYEGVGAEEEWEEIVASLAAFEGHDIYIGFHYIGEYADEWTIDDVNISSASLHDLGIEEVSFPSTVQLIGCEPYIRIHNFASSTENSYQISLTINNGAEDVYVYDETMSQEIGPNEDLWIALVGWDAVDLGLHTIEAVVNVSGDEYSGNDTITGTIEVVKYGWYTPHDLEIPSQEYLGSSAVDVENGKFYAIGGNPDGIKLSIFDVESGEWSVGADLPEYSSLGGAAYANGKIYTHRGDGGSKGEPTDDFWIYDVASDEWSVAASSPGVLRWTKVIYNPNNNYIYTVGGRSSNETLNTIYAYDIDNDTWAEATPMPVAEFGGSAVFQNDKLYVVGGYGTDDLLSEVQVGTFSDANPLEITWSTETADYPTPIYKAQAGTFMDGRIVVSGGVDMSSDVWTPTPLSYYYDIEEDTWTQVQDQTVGILGGFEGTLYVGGEGEPIIPIFINTGGYDGNQKFGQLQALVGIDESFIEPPFDLFVGYEVIGNEALVHLDWDFEGCPNMDNFNIYRSTDNINFEPVGSTTDLEFEETITESGSYYYRVSAVCDGNESPPSETVEIDIILFSPPYNLVVQELDGFVSMEWEFESCSGFENYNVYRSIDSINFDLVGTVTDEYFEEVFVESAYYYYAVTAICNGIESPFSEIVGVDVFVAIEENEVANLSIYPNPNSGIIHINSNSKVNAVRIFNLAGELIREERIDRNNFVLNVEGLSGIYLIQLITPGNTLNKRIMVK